MRTVEIKFPNGRIEKMLLHKIDKVADIITALRSRGTLHGIDAGTDVEDYFNEGWLYLEDAMTGNHIVSVFW